jgi:hypothetical protein
VDQTFISSNHLIIWLRGILALKNAADQRGSPIWRSTAWNRGSEAIVVNAGYWLICANSTARS